MKIRLEKDNTLSTAIKAVSIKDKNDVYYITSAHKATLWDEHYMCLDDFQWDELEGKTFTITKDEEDLFHRIPNFGIVLRPDKGYGLRIPCYGVNNGYYCDNLSIVVTKHKDHIKAYRSRWDDENFNQLVSNSLHVYDVKECQIIMDKYEFEKFNKSI